MMSLHRWKPWAVAVTALVCAALPSSFAAEPGGLIGGEAGRLQLVADGAKICTLAPAAADDNWNFYGAKAAPAPSAGAFAYTLDVGSKRLNGDLAVNEKDDAVNAAWRFTATSETALQALAVVSDFTVPELAGSTWETDKAHGVFPAAFAGVGLFGDLARSLTITFPNKRVVKFSFPRPVLITLQDNRLWGGATFTMRLGRGPGKLAAEASFTLEMAVTMSEGIRYSREKPDFLQPVTLQAGNEWVPIQEDLNIVPGSALDLSGAGFAERPCGVKGRVIVTPGGHFAYAAEPDKPRRFYGVNLCFGSLYLPKEEVDILLDRLVRLGYNAIRIHHYETGLARPSGNVSSDDKDAGFDWNPAKVDELDYLMAGCAKRGIWLTTDLFVSRIVSGKQIGLPETQVSMGKFKMLVPVYEPAYQDWVKFARKFLDRVNPYTGNRVADEPALAWISLVNEGPATVGWGETQHIPEWAAAWNRWLAAQYPSRDALRAALGDLANGEDPASNSVILPATIEGNSARGRLCRLFVADTEKASFTRMRAFLRDELKCPALLTNMNNAGDSVVPLQGARAEFDYVDEHFYVDHPTFPEKEWQLPSFCPNANPIASGASGSSGVASVRIFGKPFTVTEFNYAGPSRFRGVGGILTGAMGALQDWDGVWRFDYGSKEASLFQPAPLDYFDLVTDPLNQAADRLALFLYLRQDLAESPSRVAMTIPPELLRDTTQNLSVSALEGAAWTTRIGNLLGSNDAPNNPQSVSVPVQSGNDPDAIAAALRKIKAPLVPQADGSIRSETGELALDPKSGGMTVDTPKSAGGYAEAGRSINAPRAGVKIDGITTGASVFVNSLDLTPIKNSKRLLVTHLTDLQNSGVRYGERARQTLLAWGGLPHLVRDGSATLHLALNHPEAYTIWALSTGGKRLEKVPSRMKADELIFTVNVRGTEGARMLYEVAESN